MNRRSFVKASASVTALSALHLHSLAASAQGPHTGENDRTLIDGWEFYRGPLDARRQVWRSEELVTWEKVTLPHCFNHYDACDPDTPAYRGHGWYRTKLTIANPYAQGRTLLHLEGAGQRAEVWAGDTKVGEHTGGYDEWRVDLTEHCQTLKSGEALQLSILCDNARDVERMPSDQSDFTLYGGLYRPAHLVYAPAVSLEAVHTHIDFEPGGPATVSVTARIYAPEAPGDAPRAASDLLELTVELFDPRGHPVHTRRVSRALWQGEQELTRVTLQQPDLWSSESPDLYRCEVTLGSGASATESAHRFGIRHTRWEEHGPFFLNGKRLLLRGTQRHEDHAGYAAAMPAELIRRELQMVRDMGANMIRLGHYQQRSLVLDLCDELGLFVWEELCWCRSGVVSERFTDLGKRLLRTMIDQHRNHPSVLIWGLGNEDDWPTEIGLEDHEAIRRYMTELRDLAHAEDPARMTGYRRGDFVKDSRTSTRRRSGPAGTAASTRTTLQRSSRLAALSLICYTSSGARTAMPEGSLKIRIRRPRS